MRYVNVEGYSDPTCGKAMANVSYEERKKRREARERIERQEAIKQAKIKAKREAHKQLMAKHRREMEKRRLDQAHWQLGWSCDGLITSKAKAV